MQVTSWNPLVVYLYEEGLGRFATELYNVEHIERRCMHLTNYSLNKHNKKFVPNTDAAQVRPPCAPAKIAKAWPRLGGPLLAHSCLASARQDDAGSKWSLSAFRRQVAQDFGEAKAAEVCARPRTFRPSLAEPGLSAPVCTVGAPHVGPGS